jgi:uncharacterized protein (TIGR03435 family)
MKRLALPVFLSLCLSAQTFGVASIKPSDPTRPNIPFRIGPASLTTAGTLKLLIALAYAVEDTRNITGGPDWVQSQFYDVEAKADAPSTPHQIKVMLQALLAERFQLKLRHETRIVSGYALTVDKGGPKLPPPRSDMPPDSTGSVQMGRGDWFMRGATMDTFAGALRWELDVPVVDETKIPGNYDFKLQFEEENSEPAPKPDGSGAPAALAPAGSIFTALRELGLRLDSRKLPIEIYVIDSAERPSAN